jgi:hypothetical protein
MPRYYFNICCDDFEATDVVGESCADDLAALTQAMRTAGEVVRQQLMIDKLAAGGWIDVEDERHRPVLRLPLRAAAY